MKTQNVYQKRRLALAQTFSRTLFVIPSGLEASRSHSVRYRFKVASDFFYLTGLQLSDAILIIAGAKCYLLQKQDHDLLWGEHTLMSTQDVERANGVNFDDHDRLSQILEDTLENFDRIAMPIGRDTHVDQIIHGRLSFNRKKARTQTDVLALCDSRTLVGSLRAVKDVGEIADLRQAGYRSSMVHKLVMQQNWVGKTERELANYIEGHFLLQNMQFTSYETIVGSGERSTILHARATDRIINADEIILIDAGAEWNGYCADITRAIPSGRLFTQAQRAAYHVVLSAQKAALAQIKPGVTLKQIHQAAVESLPQKSMPHSTSHWIGLDVHDPCAYVDDEGRDIKLKAGMCFTVEPGSYLEGIGVRIEDDVVVTEEGYELLTSAPKEIEEIETLRSLIDDN